MPVGPENMNSVYQTAITYLDNALTNAGGDDELELQIISTRARAKHALAIWGLLNPPGSTPGNPLINDAGARADALAILARIGTTTDFRFEAQYGPTTVRTDIGFQVNTRLELRFADRYSVPDANGKRRVSTRLVDPITGDVDPAVDGVMDRFEEGGANGKEYPNYVLATAREMHLIVAEAELAAGNQAGFELHINHVRAMDNLPDFTGQIDNVDMLVHERQANLYLMGRRLNDMYRFGVVSDNWEAGSVALVAPGTLLPISQGERESNLFCVENPSIC